MPFAPSPSHHRTSVQPFPGWDLPSNQPQKGMGNDVPRLELPTATLRVPVMLVLCAMASNQAPPESHGVLWRKSCSSW